MTKLSCTCYLKFLHKGVVDSYICILQETVDQSSGAIRWSMPRRERCFCQKVIVYPISDLSNSDSTATQSDSLEDLWFTDNPAPLVKRRNWMPEKLDILLDRVECCKFSLICFCLGVLL